MKCESYITPSSGISRRTICEPLSRMDGTMQENLVFRVQKEASKFVALVACCMRLYAIIQSHLCMFPYMMQLQ
ncbi:unnamed protein product [Cylicocyclus nassatus]|uniref:Uncharacterized protein n=1 Tax=Cylicocyclus nassatus TaxID=53992 RepID=A0AA36GGF2_CYLNA|nr:unnamed protein product [Cylicocyclus nassatus]